MDPWKDNPIQEGRVEDLGFFGSLLAQFIAVGWALVAVLGLLWFWPHHKTVTIIATLLSIVFCFIFLAIKKHMKNKTILIVVFVLSVCFGILSYLVQA